MDVIFASRKIKFMQINKYTDYSFRVLIFLGIKKEELATIDEIFNAYEISRSHLVQVVHGLAKEGFIESIQGRSGGIRLAKPVEEINLKDVLVKMETNFYLAECFDSSGYCKITPACILKDVLQEAGKAFLDVLEKYTLADLLKKETASLRKILTG